MNLSSITLTVKCKEENNCHTMIVIFCLRTKNSCRISKSTTLPQVTSDIITFSTMVRFSCVLLLWKAIELMIMPVLTVLKNIEN